MSDPRATLARAAELLLDSRNACAKWQETQEVAAALRALAAQDAGTLLPAVADELMGLGTELRRSHLCSLAERVGALVAAAPPAAPGNWRDAIGVIPQPSSAPTPEAVIRNARDDLPLPATPKPVAWMIVNHEGNADSVLLKKPSESLANTFDSIQWRVVPLYAAAPVLGASAAEADSKRLDWLEQLLRGEDGVYAEVFFAGLRQGNGVATACQLEANPEVFPTTHASELRSAIDAAQVAHRKAIELQAFHDRGDVLAAAADDVVRCLVCGQPDCIDIHPVPATGARTPGDAT